MNCRKSIYEFIQKFDMFGKEPTLYYKGEEKKSTNLGIIFSLLYIVFYAAYFVYKLIRMVNKVDFAFYDTLEYIENPPSINLTKDNFYGGFGLEHPKTYDPFIDETIYFPKAYYKLAKKDGDEWKWDVKELELERCKLEKFGKFFQSKFNRNALNNLYCFKEMNESLVGHFSFDNYSLFFISFFPCINTTENNNHCKSSKEINEYLENAYVSLIYGTKSIDHYNISNPIYNIINSDIFFISFDYVKRYYYYFSKEKYYSDNGIIFNSNQEYDLYQYHHTNFDLIEK